MIRVLKIVGLVTAVFAMSAASMAQPDPCLIQAGDFCTYTQGGFGNMNSNTNCQSGGNPGCIRNTCFPIVFPTGLTVGGGFTIHFSSAAAIRDFLPAGSTPSSLTSNHVDPTSTEAGVFAGQVVTLALNVGFGNAGCGGMSDIGSLEVGSGDFAGYTVDQILALANEVLGGDLSNLPEDTDVSNLNEIVDDINQNFDDCESNDGVLVLPGCDGEDCLDLPPMWVEIGSHFCLDFCGNPITVYWCCPLDGLPVFQWTPGCFSENGPCNNDCDPLEGDLTWTVVYDSSNVDCPLPGGYWTATFTATGTGCACIFFERQLAVEMIGYTAIARENDIQLNWSTASENGSDHFEIYRDGTPSAMLQGQGTSATLSNYAWADATVHRGRTYNYELISVDVNGIRTSQGTRTVEFGGQTAGVITEFALHSNFPNPFNPTTTISFDLPEASPVRLIVTDAIGREVRELVNGEMNAGTHAVEFDAKALPSGIYFCTIRAGSFGAAQKMLLLK